MPHFARLGVFIATIAAVPTSIAAAPITPSQSSTRPANMRQDRRLAAKVDLKELGRPLREVLPALGQKLGVRLAAAENVADDRLIVFSRQKPGIELLERVAQHVEGEWQVTETGYRLTRTEEAKKRDERLEREEFAAIRNWMDRLGKLSETPEAQLRARQAEVDRLLSLKETPESARGALEEERDLLRDRFRHSRAVPVAVDLFRVLSRPQVEQLRSQGYVRLSSTHGSLPSSFFERTHAALPNHSVAPGREPHHVDARFELEERAIDRERYNSPRILRLSVDLTAIIRSSGGGHSSSTLNWAARVPAVGILSPGSRVPPQDELHQRMVNLDSEPAKTPLELETYGAQVHLLNQWPSGWLPLGEVLSRVHAATGLEILADSYTRTRLDPKRMGGMQSAVALLDRVSEDLGYTWSKEGSTVRMWSRTRFQDRAGEVPEPVLRRFRERQLRQAQPTLDDLAALATSLNDRQCRNLADLWGWYFEGLGVSPPWDSGGVFGLRHHLRLWGTLTTAQRRAAEAGVISMESMLPVQRKALGIAISAPGQDLVLDEYMRVPTPERLAGLTGGFTVKLEERVAQSLIDDQGGVTTSFGPAGQPIDLFNLTRFGGRSLRTIGPTSPIRAYRFTYYLSPGPDNNFARSVQVHLVPRWQPK